MLRIGLLTSGGDCQALNATMRGIVKTLMTNSEEPIEIYGFEDGYQGLIYSRFRVMTPAEFSRILTRDGLQRATTKWDLRPKLLMLNDALGVLSSGQRMFLSAMVSFYNAREGGAMLKRCGFEGLSDLGGLDLERRKVIADLTLNYNGW